ncbi:hypothetical protein GJ496_011843 [Pomphorhynchus laevis]|nr:hypothetical protein GJ496_011843 [Pomphorhynchus laevis]
MLSTEPFYPCTNPYFDCNETYSDGVAGTTHNESSTTNVIRNKSSSNTMISSVLGKCDIDQVDGLNDLLISVDDKDCSLGSISKLHAHVINNATGKCPLHRAFSLFIFTNKNNVNGNDNRCYDDGSEDGDDCGGRPKLLIQKRSSKKITFPECWTNSCCSHPNYNEIELIEGDHIGIRHAAIRRTKYELNIDIPSVDDITFMGKVKYSACCSGVNSNVFGENEIDYILFCQLDDLTESAISPNLNEVSEIRFVTAQDANDIIKSSHHDPHLQNICHGNTDSIQTTPWFRMIVRNFLCDNWPDSKSAIKSITPISGILNMFDEAYSDYEETLEIRHKDYSAEHNGSNFSIAGNLKNVQLQQRNNKSMVIDGDQHINYGLISRWVRYIYRIFIDRILKVFR